MCHLSVEEILGLIALNVELLMAGAGSLLQLQHALGCERKPTTWAQSRCRAPLGLKTPPRRPGHFSFSRTSVSRLLVALDLTVAIRLGGHLAEKATKSNKKHGHF